MTRAAPGQFGACNGLRGVGAVLIAAGHFGVLMRLEAFRHIEVVTVLVDMFFVFSGLVMAHAYGDKLAGGASVPEFLLRRVGRVWPMHVAMLAVLVAWECVKLGLAGGGGLMNRPFDPNGLTGVATILPNLLLLNAVGLTDNESWNFPSWTIGAELVAYVAFALVFARLFRWRLAIAATTVVLCVGTLMLFAPRGMRATFDFGAVRCLAGFFAGVIVREALLRRPLVGVVAGTILEAVALAGFAAFAWFASDTIWAFALPLALSLFVYVVACEDGLLTRAVFPRPFQILAEWSYSIYMVHAVVLVGFISAMRFGGRTFGRHWLDADPVGAVSVGPFADLSKRIVNLDPAQSWMVLGAYLAVVLAASAVTYRYVETPGRVWFGRLARRFAKPAPPRSDRRADERPVVDHAAA